MLPPFHRTSAAASNRRAVRPSPRWLTASWLALLFAGTCAAADPTPASASADEDYAAFEAVVTPSTPVPKGERQYLAWMDEQRQRITVAAQAFWVAHPEDPRRWDAILIMTLSQPLFLVPRNIPGEPYYTVDGEAKATWEQEAEQWREALLAAPDSPPPAREVIEWRFFTRAFRDVSVAQSKGEPFDYEPLWARLELHLQRYAGLEILAARAQTFLTDLERRLPDQAAANWQRLKRMSDDPALQAMAEQRLVELERLKQPIDVAFTAVDGREVDLKQLRGKVVLLDFWATWCGPCKEEIPNVVGTYEKYHGQGFEVIGVALENARLAPKDTPAELEAKLARARDVLLTFVREHDMPWPQYFDGKANRNEIATSFGVKGIPAMFLIDQSGHVVSTNARGEQLEAEVKRLLER